MNNESSEYQQWHRGGAVMRHRYGAAALCIHCAAVWAHGRARRVGGPWALVSQVGVWDLSHTAGCVTEHVQGLCITTTPTPKAGRKEEVP